MKLRLFAILVVLGLSVALLGYVLLRRPHRSADAGAFAETSPTEADPDLREPSDASELRVPESEAADPDRVEAPGDVPIEAAPVVTLTREELWAQEYREFSASEIEAEMTALREAIHEGSFDELKRRLDAGLGEYLGNTSQVPFSEADQEKITCVLQKANNGGNYRVILPENEFPELYQLKAKELWLKEVWYERRRQELLAAERRNAPKK